MEAPMSTPQQGQEDQHSKRLNSGEDSAAAAAAATIAAVDQDGKKRKFDHDGFHGSKYFKICSIVKELRPLFVEVSRIPNFRDSKAASEIQIRMKNLVELAKQLGSEASSITKCHEAPVKETLSEAVIKEENIEKPGDEPAASLNAIENGIRGLLEEDSLLNNAKIVSEK